MANPFGDLTYNNKVIKPTLRPVEAIAGMYDMQSKNYEYAIDNTNKNQTLLTSIPTDKNTKHVVMDAQKAFDEAIAPIAEKGDWENYALNSKQLTYDLANKHGLSAVQNYNTQKQSYIDAINARDDISTERKREYIRDAERNTTPLTYDKELKKWQGSYNGREATKQTNWAKELITLTNDFKADSLTFKDANGNPVPLIRTKDGYAYETTGEEVSEEQLMQFAKNYLAGDPNFRSELQEDIYFDMNNLLYDEETGTKREMVTKDITDNFHPSYIEKGREMFDLGDGKLEEELKKKDITPEEFYGQLKAEEKINLAAGPAIYKEGYSKIEHKFLNKGNESNDGTINGESPQAVLDKQFVAQRNTVEDLINTQVLHSTAKTTLAEAEKTLEKIKASPTKNPVLIADQEAIIAEQKRILDATIDKQSKNLDLVPEIKKDIQNLASGISNEVEGLDASFSTLQKLVYRKLAGEDVSTELDQYINEDKIVESIYSKSEQNKDASARTINTLVAAKKERSRNKLNAKLNQLVEGIKKSADAGQIAYTEEFNSFEFSQDMKAEDRRNHPIRQLESRTDAMSGKTLEYYTKFEHPNGKRIEDYIKHDLKKWEKVNWEKTKVHEIVEAVRDTKGNYRPVVTMEISVEKDGEERKITVPAFVDDEAYNTMYFESIGIARKTLMDKKQKGTLTPSEELQLNKFNATAFDVSKQGKTFPNTQLYNASDGDIIPIEVTEDSDGVTREVKVEVATSGTPSGFTYFLLGEGTTDEKGNPVKTYWATDKNNNYVEVTKSQLEPNERGTFEYKPIGGNTPRDLRVMMGEMTANVNRGGGSSSTSNGGVDSDMVDLTSIFNADIKQGVDPKIAKEVAPYAQQLKEHFPGLIITDALRPQDADYGSDTSLHKIGKGLDFRLNKDSKELLNLTEREKRLFGIKSVGLHNGNHIHLEFI